MALTNPDQLKLLKKPPKYRNQRVKGDRAGSKKERERRLWLRACEATGAITHLCEQRSFDLCVNEEHICTYVADFEYYKVSYPYPSASVANFERVVEDVKPDFRTKESEKKYKNTPAYRMFTLKKRLMLAIHSIDVMEV